MGSTLTNVGTFFVIVGMLLSGLLMVTSFSESRANGGWKTVGGARRRAPPTVFQPPFARDSENDVTINRPLNNIPTMTKNVPTFVNVLPISNSPL